MSRTNARKGTNPRAFVREIFSQLDDGLNTVDDESSIAGMKNRLREHERRTI